MCWRARPAPDACRLRSLCRPLHCPSQTSSHLAPVQATLQPHQSARKPSHRKSLHKVQVSTALRCRRVTLIENLSAPSSYGTRPPPASAADKHVGKNAWHLQRHTQECSRSAPPAACAPAVRHSSRAAGSWSRPRRGRSTTSASGPGLGAAHCAAHPRLPRAGPVRATSVHLNVASLYLLNTCEARARLCM